MRVTTEEFDQIGEGEGAVFRPTARQPEPGRTEPKPPEAAEPEQPDPVRDTEGAEQWEKPEPIDRTEPDRLKPVEEPFSPADMVDSSEFDKIIQTPSEPFSDGETLSGADQMGSPSFWEDWQANRKAWEGAGVGGEIAALVSAIYDRATQTRTGEKVERAAELVSYPIVDAYIGIASAVMHLGAGVTDWVNRASDALGLESPEGRRAFADGLEEMSMAWTMDRQEQILDLFAEGKSSEAFYRSVSGAFGDVYGNMKLFLAIGAAVMKGGAVTREATWSQVAQYQGARAMFGFWYGFANTKGDMNDRIRAGLLTFAYMSTPIASSAAASTPLAVGADFLLNSLIDAGYRPDTAEFTWPVEWVDGRPQLQGQYQMAREQARQEAEELGMPDIEDQLFWRNVIPVLGASAGFSLLTRSANSNNDATMASLARTRPPQSKMSPEVRQYYEMLDRTINSQLDPALRGRFTSETINAMLDGRISIDSINAAHRAGERMGWMDRNDTLTRLNPDTAREGGRMQPVEREVSLEREVTDAATRIDSPESLMRVLDAMPTRENAMFALVTFAQNPASWPKMQRLWWSKVHAGEILREPEQPRVGPTVEAARALEQQRTPEQRDIWGERKESWEERVVQMSPKSYLEMTGAKTISDAMDSPARVQELRSVWERGEKMDPVSVRVDEQGRVIEQEGNHRAQAALEAGQQSIPVYVSVWRGSTALRADEVPESILALQSRTPEPQMAPREQPLTRETAAQAEAERRSAAAMRTQAKEARAAVDRAWEAYEKSPQAQKAEQLRIAFEELEAKGATPRQLEQARARWTKANERAVQSKEYARWQERTTELRQAEEAATRAEAEQPPKVKYKAPDKKTVVIDLAREWKPNPEPWTPERIASIEGLLPETARVAVNQDFQVERPSLVSLARNTDAIQDLIRKTRSLDYGKSQVGQDGKVRLSKGDRLHDGMTIALSRLKDDPAFNGFNFEDRLRAYVRGDEALKGFGPSSMEAMLAAWRADSPEEAIRLLNNMRLQRSTEKKVVQPLVDTDLMAAGGTPRPPEYRLPDDMRQLIRQHASSKVGDEVLDRFMDTVRDEPPRSPDAFDAWMRSVNLFLERSQKRAHNRDPNDTNRRDSMYAELGRGLQSARYYFNNLAMDTGDMRLARVPQRFDLDTRRASYDADLRTKYVMSGSHSRRDVRFMARVSSDANIEQAIIARIGLSPDAAQRSGKESLLWNRSQEILGNIKNNDPKFFEKIEAFVERVESEFQGTTAVNVRELQFERWRRKWESPSKRVGPTLAQRWADAQASGNKNELAAVQAELRQILPYRWLDGKVQQVDVAEMVTRLGIFNSQGRDGLRDYLRFQSDGTRKHYWMTDGLKQFDKTETLDTFMNLDPATGRATGANLDSAINSRGEFNQFKGGSLFANLYRHIYNLEVQSRTYSTRNEMLDLVNRYADEGLISQSAKKRVELWGDNQWGRGPTPEGWALASMKMNSFFWTAYPLQISRIAWYSARNMMYQGVPWGVMTTQFKVGDIATAYPEVIKNIRDPNSLLIRWLNDRFESDSSQKRVIFNEQALLRDPASLHDSAIKQGVIPDSVRKALNQMWMWSKDYSGAAIGMSDTVNRFSVGSMSFTLSERYVNRWLKGELDYNGVENGLMLKTLTPTQRSELAELWDRGVQAGGDKNSFYDWISRVAEIKNENANFLYRLGGKGMFEQEPGTRQWLGLQTYPRGTVELFYQNGYRPFTEQMTKLLKGEGADMDQLRQGLRVMGMQQVAMAMSGVVFDEMVGRRRGMERMPTYSALGSALAGPGSPGFGTIITDLWGGVIDVQRLMVEQDYGRALDLSVNRAGTFALWYAPILNDVANWAEASQNVVYADNHRAIMSGLTAALSKITDMVDHDPEGYKHIERSFYEQFIKHPMFGTVFTEQDERDLIERLAEQGLFGQVLEWIRD